MNSFISITAYNLQYILSLDDTVLQSATPTSMPSLSRNGTILLELKRQYVSQRLDELQAALGHIRQCQQRDSKSKDGTRGRTQTDSSSTQQETRQQYPGIDGFSPADSQPQDSSLSQQTKEIRGLGPYTIESQLSEQQRSESLLDCKMLESQDQQHL